MNFLKLSRMIIISALNVHLTVRMISFSIFAQNVRILCPLIISTLIISTFLLISTPFKIENQENFSNFANKKPLEIQETFLSQKFFFESNILVIC